MKWVLLGGAALAAFFLFKSKNTVNPDDINAVMATEAGIVPELLTRSPETGELEQAIGVIDAAGNNPANPEHHPGSTARFPGDPGWGIPLWSG